MTGESSQLRTPSPVLRIPGRVSTTAAGWTLRPDRQSCQYLGRGFLAVPDGRLERSLDGVPVLPGRLSVGSDRSLHRMRRLDCQRAVLLLRPRLALQSQQVIS